MNTASAVSIANAASAKGSNDRSDRESSSIDGPKALASIDMTIPTPSGTIEAAAIATIQR